MYFLRYSVFCKKFSVQTYGRQFFDSQFSWNKKKNLSSRLFMLGTSNFHKMFFASLRKKYCSGLKKKIKHLSKIVF